MKAKYGSDFEPLRGKHAGFTFTPSRQANSVQKTASASRTRYSNQLRRMQCNQKAITNWRNMSVSSQAAWLLFASTYPQPSEKNPDYNLNGYQLFVRRNTYHFLHEGLQADFIEFPVMESLPEPTFFAEVSADGMCLNVTDWYIENFGILPKTGSFLLCRIVPMATNSGQFFTPYSATLEVTSDFIDGLFLSLNFSGALPDITFSVYLSAPVHAGRIYNVSKFRFMGCFKPTKFVQLTDTPSEYVGQSGKFVAVNADENALEFVNAGGGGLNCSDLDDCSIIQNLNSSVSQMAEILVPSADISIPAVHYGMLYNAYTAKSAMLPSSSEWRCLTWADWNAFKAYVSSIGKTGNDLKDTGDSYWSSAIGLNTLKFFGRGAGVFQVDGNYSRMRVYNYMWSADYPSRPERAYVFYLYSSSSTFAYLSASTQWNRAYSIRLCRDAVGIPDGTVGFYVGNDSRVYRTTHIGGLEILADNLAETKFSDGSLIPYYDNGSDFVAQSSAACIAPNADISNV